eukprot:scaffold569621_cov15-Prasinocladus_malaysianus.AAC.1
MSASSAALQSRTRRHRPELNITRETRDLTCTRTLSIIVYPHIPYRIRSTSRANEVAEQSDRRTSSITNRTSTSD